MRSFKNVFAGAAVALGLTVSAVAAEPTKVGFVYVGTVGDGGWTFNHDAGRKAVQEEFGDKVITSFVESVPKGADAQRVMTQMALSGIDIIFTTSFGYMDSTLAVAAKFPDVKFEHATGYKTAPNMSTYSARFYEGRAIMGHIAGNMTKTNKIGYIASFPIPEVIRGINASFIHARNANPDVEMKIIWLYTWFDPAKEADATKALIQQGVDVIFAHTDSTAPLATLADLGGYGFGQADDMLQYAPKPRLSAIVTDWGPYYIERVQAVMDGTWESKSTWHGIDKGMVVIGEFSEEMPAELRAEAAEMRDAIVAGTFHPFTGPLNKQDGSVWLKDGEVADDAALRGIKFFVEGISGDIPG